MLLALSILVLAALALYACWPHRCPANDPLCLRHKPCVTCWKAGVAKLQAGMAQPPRTQERMPKVAEKPVLVRRRG